MFTREALRTLDRLAVEEFGVPSIVLMENAARAVADAAAAMRRVRAGGGVLVVCGAGSNGGDGLAAARHLANAGVPVMAALAATDERFAGDAGANLRIDRAMRIPMSAIDPMDASGSLRRAAAVLGGRLGLLIDALLGTGLETDVRSPHDLIIAAINDMGRSASVLAVDVPSGLDVDTGRALGRADAPAVRADMTVTFAGLKRGFLSLEAQRYLGRVKIADIGAPWELTERLGEIPLRSAHPGRGAARLEAGGG